MIQLRFNRIPVASVLKLHMCVWGMEIGKVFESHQNMCSFSAGLSLGSNAGILQVY